MKKGYKRTHDPGEGEAQQPSIVGAEAHDGGTAINMNVPQVDPFVLRAFSVVCILLVVMLAGTYMVLVLRTQEAPVSLTSLLSAVVGAIIGLITPQGMAAVGGGRSLTSRAGVVRV